MYHSSEMMTVSTGNVLSGTVSSNVVIRPLTHVKNFSNPHPQISSSATLYLPASFLTVNCCSQLQGVPFPNDFQQLHHCRGISCHLRISQFRGEKSSKRETFSDWLEQFEAVAQLAGWSEDAKLVNLTTYLRGTAYSFLPIMC